MKTEIEVIEINLLIAKAFSEKYPQLEEIDHSLSFFSSKIQLTIFCHDEDTRSQILAGIGQLLGREGWVTDEEYGGKYLNWKRTVDGVEVSISRAEKLDTPPAGFPVSPTKFPLMLMEAE